MSPCQLTCLALALLVNFSSAEAFQGGQPTAFFSVRGGESRPFTRDSSLNVLDESVGEEQAVNGDIKQIRVTNGKRFGSTRMPPKMPPKNGFRNLPTDNISASAISIRHRRCWRCAPSGTNTSSPPMRKTTSPSFTICRKTPKNLKA